MLSSDMRMDILKHGRVSKRGKIRKSVSWVYMLKTKKIILNCQEKQRKVLKSMEEEIRRSKEGRMWTKNAC